MRRTAADAARHGYVLPAGRVGCMRAVDAPGKDALTGKRDATVYLFVAPPRR